MTLDALYSSLVITAEQQGHPPQWDLFSYGRSQMICGFNEVATRIHTNVPRSGTVGLPMNWEAWITRWRAATSLRYVDDPIMDWAAETYAELRYNDRVEASLPLAELLLSPQPVGEQHNVSMRRVDGAQQPIGRYLWIRENLGYEVRITPETRVAEQCFKRLQEYLIEKTQTHRLTLWIRLEGEVIRSDI